MGLKLGQVIHAADEDTSLKSFGVGERGGGCSDRPSFKSISHASPSYEVVVLHDKE